MPSAARTWKSLAGSLLRRSPAGLTMQIQNTQGRLSSSEQFGAIIVHRGPQGQLVHLSDVARIELGGDSYSSQPAHQPDGRHRHLPVARSNAIQVSDEVRAAGAVSTCAHSPPGMTYHIVYDPTVFVRDMIHEVQMTRGDRPGGGGGDRLPGPGALLILADRRAGVPDRHFCGDVRLLDQLALALGLVLSIGIVVDDAIVVVENVERKIEGGRRAWPPSRPCARSPGRSWRPPWCCARCSSRPPSSAA